MAELPIKKRVLVTGGTGFVGSHLVERLLEKGYAVTCLVRDLRKLQWLAGLPVELIRGDCSQPGSLAPALRGVSAVFHVAGLTKARHPRDYYRVNHLGARNVLEACAGHSPGIEKFVLVSSLAAAGPGRDGTPVSSQDIPRPVSDYGKSKLLAEEETLKYREVFPVVILRPSAVYGPRDRDMFELFRWAVRGVMIEFAGGERYLNPCYVEDLVSAMVLAMEKETPSGSIYCIAENRAYSWSEFRKALLSSGKVKAHTIKIPTAAAYLIGLLSEFGSMFTGRPALTNRQKVREASQRYWICDLSATGKELGFTAEHSLQQGLTITWRWYRDNHWLR